MGKCKDCGYEMMSGHGCVYDKVKIEGVWYDRFKFGETDFDSGAERCHDCGVTKGFHHFGCDAERNPDGGQMLMTDVEAIKSTERNTIIEFE